MASRSPRGGSRSNALRSVTAEKPRFSSWTREWSLIVTCSESARRGGMSTGVCSPARCQGRSWWWKTTRPSCSASTDAASLAASGLIGSEQRFSTITRSAPAKAAASAPAFGVSPSTGSMARKGSKVSSGRAPSSSSPATRRTSKPSSWSAHSHLRASTATPSTPPSRYDTWTATGTTPETHADRPGSGDQPARPRSARTRRRLVASRRARVTGVVAVTAHDRRPGDDELGRRVHVDDGHDCDPSAADPRDLGVGDVDRLRRRFHLSDGVERGSGDELWSRRRSPPSPPRSRCARGRRRRGRRGPGHEARRPRH